MDFLSCGSFSMCFLSVEDESASPESLRGVSFMKRRMLIRHVLGEGKKRKAALEMVLLSQLMFSQSLTLCVVA
jgi:hypothetical protein